jgi:hypothetical protein
MSCNGHASRICPDQTVSSKMKMNEIVHLSQVMHHVPGALAIETGMIHDPDKQATLSQFGVLLDTENIHHFRSV